jgi:hypothetical protein
MEVAKKRRHPDHVEGWTGDMKSLAVAVGKMRYDKVVEFLLLLKDEFINQVNNDRRRGRVRLAVHLHAAVLCLTQSGSHMKHAWKICQPYFERQCKNCKCFLSDSLDGHLSVECTDHNCPCHGEDCSVIGCNYPHDED